MKQETESQFARLEAICWFSRLGEKIDLEGYTRIPSFSEFKRIATSRKWTNFHIPIWNRLMEAIDDSLDRSEESYIGLVDSLHERSDRILKKIDFASARHDLEFLRREVRGVILASAMEIEFAPLIPPLFKIPIVLPVYEQGFVGLGWDGDWMPQTWSGDTFRDLPSGNLKYY
jgi:hypothetical protein